MQHETLDTDLGVRRRLERLFADPRGLAVQVLAPRGSRRRARIERIRSSLPARRTDRASAHHESNRPVDVLVVVDRVPTPRRDAGSLRLSYMLTVARDAGLSIGLVVLEDGAEDLTLASELAVERLIPVRALNRYLSEAGAPNACWFVRPEQFGALERRLRAAYPHATIIYDTVDLHSDRLHARARITGALVDRLRARMITRIERAAIQTADHVIVVTPEEGRTVNAIAPGTQVHLVPTMHDVSAAPSARRSARRDLVFVGGFAHHPNVDAAAYIVDEIGPQIAAALPNVSLRIVGDNPPHELVERATPPVEFTGWVDDLDSVYREARVVVAPLRYGAGLKGKVGEAMAHGVPVVTTPVGADGYGAEPGVHLEVAHTTAEFVKLVAEVYEDETRWSRLADNGRQLISDRFSVEAGSARVRDLLRRL